MGKHDTDNANLATKVAQLRLSVRKINPTDLFQWAFESNNTELIPILKSDPVVASELRGVLERTFLHIAILTLNVELTCCLLDECKVNPNLLDKFGKTPRDLISKMESNNDECQQIKKKLIACDALLKSELPPIAFVGPDISSKEQQQVFISQYEATIVPKINLKQDSSLHDAVKNKDATSVGKLLQNGYDVNEIDNEGASALHYCVTKMYHDSEILQLLINHGAKRFLKTDMDPFTKSPFTLAAENNLSAALKYAIDNKIEASAKIAHSKNTLI